MCFSSFQSKTSCCLTNTELENNNYYCVVPLMKTSHQNISIAKFNLFCFCFGSVKHKAIPENTLIAKVSEDLRFFICQTGISNSRSLIQLYSLERRFCCLFELRNTYCNELWDFMYSMHFEFVVFILHWPTCSAFFCALGNCIFLVHQRNTLN